MGFQRKGSPEPITNIDLQYDKSKEKEVKCPKCGKEVKIQASNGIKRVGSKMVIGSIAMKCPHCGSDITI